MDPGALVFYISGHGFGHASRQIEILNALGPLLPSDTGIIVRTAAAKWLFDRTLKPSATLLPGECDTGIVQIDSLRLDEPATVRTARDFYASFRARVDAERGMLRDRGVRLVVADAPPLACAVAKALGVPCVVISNFTWDWIYEAYERRFGTDAPDVLPMIRDAYAQAAAGWRMPMGGGFATFATVADLPFVARHASRPREAVLEALHLPAGKPLVLASFGGYGLNGFDLDALDCRETWTVVVTGRTPSPALPRGVAYVDENELYARGLRYEDLVAAVDVVATKPGYGIISECVANGTAMLYTSRGRFPEYDVMVRELRRVLRSGFIAQNALFAGRWRDALDAVHSAPPPPEKPPTDGAELAAERILAML